jgi:hypothetical protein
MYPWSEPGWKYLRRVQAEKRIVERKNVINEALRMAGVLAGRVLG